MSRDDGFDVVMADLNINDVDSRIASPAHTVVADGWMAPVVDTYSYTRVRDAIQERWIAFANGETPWNEEKVWVFGPEAETGERSRWIFDGRRRRGGVHDGGDGRSGMVVVDARGGSLPQMACVHGRGDHLISQQGRLRRRAAWRIKGQRAQRHPWTVRLPCGTQPPCRRDRVLSIAGA